MKKSETQKQSIQFLKELVNSTPKNELTDLINSFKNLDIEGPTYEEYLNHVQSSFEYNLEEELIIESFMCNFVSQDNYRVNFPNKYYSPPPLFSNNSIEKDSSLFEESFFLV